MKFDKYQTMGAYHWTEFSRPTIYRNHALKVKKWIKEKNVLDIGAGDGLITHLLNCKGIDIDPLAVSLAQQRKVDVHLDDIYTITGHYDAVFLGDILEHLKHPQQAIKQISQITNKIYITTPPRQKDKLYPYHFQEWTPEELKKFFEKLGWIQISSEVANVRIYAIFIYKNQKCLNNT